MKGILIFFVFSILFLISGIFLLHKFNETKAREKLTLWLLNQKILAEANKPPKQQTAVLGIEAQIPQSYILSLSPRKQVFNLSCEFAAAAAILYHYKNDEFFSAKNELTAEKALIAKIPSSMNPNIGIRMGEDATESAELVYRNLNNRFGGTEYYGVHAPPFIDLFWQYGLLARPIQKGDIDVIKKAIFSGHLVMTWIKTGYGKAVDVALSYGSTPVIKGEHVVVIYGYNQDGVFVMDPGIGNNRFLSYQTLLEATDLFPIPFLEVNPSVNAFSYEPTEKVDLLTGLDREKIKITVQNASREVGVGSAMAAILKDFGYQVLSMEQIADEEKEGVSILLKKELIDYAKLLRQDISLAGYKISSFSAAITLEASTEAIVVIGE